jgi:fucose 4-O-acetylase-like acetyltransferase
MFLSGYVSYQVVLLSSTIKKRAIQLLIPFFIWPIFSQILGGHTVDLSIYVVILKNPENGLWFLWSLFFITVFLYFFDSVSRKIRIRQEYVVLLGVILLMGLGMVLKKKTGSNDFGLNVTAYHMIFYMQGFYTKKYQQLLISFLRKGLPVFCVIFFVSAYFWKRHEAPAFLPSQYFNVHIVNVLYRLMVATVGISMFYGLAQRYIGIENSNGGITIINKIGKKTLGIYCIQFNAIGWSKMLFSSSNLFIQVSLCFVLATIISVFLEWLFSQNKFTALLFVGKNEFKE